MIRFSESQARLFTTAKRGPAAPRVRRKKEELPENIVVSQISGFLRAHGWTVTRQQSGLFTRRMGEQEGMVRIGEKGTSDWRSERRVSGLLHWLFYWEAKAPGRKPNPLQLAWIERRMATGTPADWFDGFDSGRKPFLPWYRRMYEPDLALTAKEQEEASW
jgi:hypothetical protein